MGPAAPARPNAETAPSSSTAYSLLTASPINGFAMSVIG